MGIWGYGKTRKLTDIEDVQTSLGSLSSGDTLVWSAGTQGWVSQATAAVTGTVNTFADLPAAADHSGEFYIVRQSSGVFFVNRYEAGVYYSDGVSWARMGLWEEMFTANVTMGDGYYFATDTIQARDSSGLTFKTSGAAKTAITIADATGLTRLAYGLEAAGDVYLGTDAASFIEVYGELSQQNGDAIFNAAYDTGYNFYIENSSGYSALNYDNNNAVFNFADDLSITNSSSITVGALTKPYVLIDENTIQLTKDVSGERNYYISVDNIDGRLQIATNGEAFYFDASGEFEAWKVKTDYLNNFFNGYFTVDAPFRNVAGSVSLPTYSFTDDPDCGIYLDGTAVSISVQGTRRIRIAQGLTSSYQRMDWYNNISNATPAVLQSYGQYNGALGSNPAGSMINEPTYQNISGSSTADIGIFGNKVNILTTGNLVNSASFAGAADFLSASDYSTALGVGGALTITNQVGYYYTDLPALASGVSITNQYGMYIEAPTRGTSNIAAHFGLASDSYARLWDNAGYTWFEMQSEKAAIIQLTTYSDTTYPFFYGRRARGTAAAPTAVQGGDILYDLQARGYGATQFSGGRGGLQMMSDQTWTDAAQGTRVKISITNRDTLTLREVFSTIGNRIYINEDQDDFDFYVNGVAKTAMLFDGGADKFDFYSRANFNGSTNTFVTYYTDGTYAGGFIPSSVTGGIAFYSVGTNPFGVWINDAQRMIVTEGGVWLPSTEAYYLGEPSTAGSWRTVIASSGYQTASYRTASAYQDYLWNDYNVVGICLKGGASAPDVITVNGGTYLEAYAFDGVNTTEYVSGVIELLHGYVEGTDIRPHLHWQPSTAGAGNVKWQLEYSIVPLGGTASTPTIISVTDAASGTAWTGEAAEFPVISGTGLTIGTQIHFAIVRDPTDAADTYADDAVLATFGIHVQTESTGSINIFSK